MSKQLKTFGERFQEALREEDQREEERWQRLLAEWRNSFTRQYDGTLARAVEWWHLGCCGCLVMRRAVVTVYFAQGTGHSYIIEGEDATYHGDAYDTEDEALNALAAKCLGSPEPLCQ